MPRLIRSAGLVMLAKLEDLFSAKARDIAGSTAALKVQLNEGQKAALGFGKALASAFIARQAFRISNFFLKPITSSVGIAANFEERLIGVGRTTGILGQELQLLGEDLRQVAIRTGQAATNVGRMGIIVGQLGIKGRQNIALFTETVAKLVQVTEDLDPESAAFGLGRLLAITRRGTKDVDKFAASIVALGNEFELTEGELIQLSIRLAPTLTGFGVAADQILGFAAALRAGGLRIESSATALSNGMRIMALRSRQFANFVGLVPEEFRNLINNDPTQAILKFVNVLGDGTRTNEQMAESLKILGLGGKRVFETFQSLALRVEAVNKALGISSNQFKVATALEEEFRRKTESLNFQMARLLTIFNDLRIQIGTALLPLIKIIVRGLAVALDILKRGGLATTAVIIGLSAALSILAFGAGIGLLVVAITQLKVALAAMSATSIFAAGALQLLSASTFILFGKIGLVILSLTFFRKELVMLGAAVASLFKPLTDVFKDLFKFLVPALKATPKFLKDFAKMFIVLGSIFIVLKAIGALAFIPKLAIVVGVFLVILATVNDILNIFKEWTVIITNLGFTIESFVLGLKSTVKDIIDPILGIGGIGQTFGGGLIPGFAEGGIVTKPTLAVVGEKGPEAIVPLSGPGVSPDVLLQATTPTTFPTVEVTTEALGGELRIEIPLVLDGEVMHRVIQTIDLREAARNFIRTPLEGRGVV